MANEVQLTLIGNLTADPEIRYTPAGHAVCSFTVVSTPRHWDKATGAWKDGEALFMRCQIWRQAAENVVESLTKGARVIVVGRLGQRSFTTKDGERRTVIEMQADEIGPSLKFATATVNRPNRQSAAGAAADNEPPF